MKLFYIKRKTTNGITCVYRCFLFFKLKLLYKYKVAYRHWKIPGMESGGRVAATTRRYDQYFKGWVFIDLLTHKTYYCGRLL